MNDTASIRAGSILLQNKRWLWEPLDQFLQCGELQSRGPRNQRGLARYGFRTLAHHGRRVAASFPVGRAPQLPVCEGDWRQKLCWVFSTGSGILRPLRQDILSVLRIPLPYSRGQTLSLLHGYPYFHFQNFLSCLEVCFYGFLFICLQVTGTNV